MRLVAGAASDVGRVRSGNEDAFLVDERLQVFAVADGMGGHSAGEIASATALETLRAAIASGDPVGTAITRANAAVVGKAESNPELAGMGTTLTVVLGTPDGAHLGHVGDSRAYLLRGGELYPLTIDHSYVEQLVQEGRLTPEQAATHPQRSVITRALGIAETVDVDEGDTELVRGDRVLLCSDGLTTMVREVIIATILAAEPDPERAANQLVDAANAAGGEDNVTAVVIDVVDAPEAEVFAPVRAINPRREPSAAPTRGPKSHGRTGGARREPGRAIARILLWALPILILIGIAVGAAAWYSKQGYFAQIEDSHVVIYRGHPGGILGFQPELEYKTTIVVADLTEAQRADLAEPKEFSSRLAVDRYIQRIETDIDARLTPTTTLPPLTPTAPTTTTGP